MEQLKFELEHLDNLTTSLETLINSMVKLQEAVKAMGVLYETTNKKMDHVMERLR